MSAAGYGPPFLVGFTGRIGSGKDTAWQLAGRWCDERGRLHKRSGFADRLKLSAARNFFPEISTDEAVRWCNLVKGEGHSVRVYAPRRRWWNRRPSIASVTGRELLQHYGTEAHREVFGTDFWVDALLPFGKDIPEHEDPDGFGLPNWWKSFLVEVGPRERELAWLCGVTDVRFENEARRIKDHRGTIVRLVRDEEGSTAGDHESEQGFDLSLVDYTLYNTGTIDELSDGVATLLTDITGVP